MLCRSFARTTLRASFFLALIALPLAAQSSKGVVDLSTARPGRDPKQPIDSAYTAKIRQYTTEAFFNSPLTDYLPASKTVPTPKVTLGDIAGAPTKLPYSTEVYAYMRSLEKATPRVKVFSIGKTEEGREMIAVAVASEALMAKLDANKAELAKLADPRTINMNDSIADAIAQRAAPVYYITGTIHSTEAGAPTACMELAYRLAVDDSPYIRNIRDHVITLITPIVEVDGRDRMVDMYEWKKKHPNETVPGVIYWGHYVQHDNNRDAMGVTLKLTENVLNTYVGFKAQVLHDLHESVALLYDNTIGDGPFNAWIDPILANEWQIIGWNNVNEMTRLGMPGVFAHGTFDTWSPGYLMFIAALHNGVSRLYETFGNGGTAETQERTLNGSDTERSWYRQNPAPNGRFKWSLRNNNNYEQTGLLTSLNYIANNRSTLLRNFYEKSKRSIIKPRIEGPAAYVLPANDPRLGAQADLLRVLQKQAVEISRATAEFTVKMPVRGQRATGNGQRGGGAGRGAGGGGGRGAGGGNADSTRADTTPRFESRTFPAGSYIIRMDQPYSRIADALLDYQYWSPNDPQKNPYDDTGWTFPEGYGVKAIRVADTAVLKAPMQTVTGTIVAANAGVSSSGSVFVINHNGDNALMTLRYKLKTADFQAAEDTFSLNGKKFNRGSFVIRGVPQDELDRTAKALGLSVTATAAAPSVKMHPLRAARVALVHLWSNTQTEGWWRQAFDLLEIPYDYISFGDLGRIQNIASKYDVLMFGPGLNTQSVIQGMPKWRNAMPWKNSPDTPNIGTWAQTDDIREGLGYEGLLKLQQFVSNGGLLITADASSNIPIELGITNGVSSATPAGNEVVGTLLRSRVADETSPIAYGVMDSLAVFSDHGMNLSVSNQRGGRAGGGAGGGRGGGGGGAGGGGVAGAGGRGGGGGSRPTGRGTPDDPDVVQGRLPAVATNLDSAPPRPATVSPWQVAVPTEEQMKNPLNYIPPDQRPRVPLRFADANQLLVSGLLDGGTDIAQRPAVVDAPVDKGHVVMFAINPIYRGETIGSYFMVFNAILNFDNLNAGRTLPAR